MPNPEAPERFLNVRASSDQVLALEQITNALDFAGRHPNIRCVALAPSFIDTTPTVFTAKPPNLHFVEGKVEPWYLMPFANESFDWAEMSYLFPALQPSGPANERMQIVMQMRDYESCLQEVERTLKTGGQLKIIEQSRDLQRLIRQFSLYDDSSQTTSLRGTKLEIIKQDTEIPRNHTEHAARGIEAGANPSQAQLYRSDLDMIQSLLVRKLA